MYITSSPLTRFGRISRSPFFGSPAAKECCTPASRQTSATLPTANVRETAEGYEVEIAAPGYAREELNVRMDERTLVVSAGHREEKTEEVNDGYTRREFHYGKFRRAFTLPENVDGERIAARYENGILTIRLPLRTTTSAPAGRQIEVR